MEHNPEKLWEPSESFKNNSNLQHYLSWLDRKYNKQFSDYNSLWTWSTQDKETISEFWESLWHYFDIQFDGQYEKALSSLEMPGAEWFKGTRLSYAEHIFRSETDKHPALIFQSEGHSRREVSWKELKQKTARLAAYMREKGVKSGDRVAAYLPNCPEALISFLACNSVGAIWSSTSPDFGVKSVIDRFQQIEPKLFITLNGYHYGGKSFSRIEESKNILKSLQSVEEVLEVNFNADFEPKTVGVDFDQAIESIPEEQTLVFERVNFEQPIWVLYSSGTTGLPKPITHSVGGILLEHLKYICFHNNIKEGDRCFWFTTTGWMMWNYINASLLCGGTVIQYDGSPAYPNLSQLWEMAAEMGINHFGTSAGFVTACMKAELNPSKEYDLSKLVSLGSTGSPLPPEGFKWLYEKVKKDLWVASISGGTDVCSAFVGGNPLWPVYEGEIQCRALGCDLQAYNESGEAVLDEVGEMVIRKPMPSMPVYFWNDDDNQRYRESYFEHFPGVWRHGDWTRITPRQGIVIYGRSDSTLNRGGVRIGTSEIYRAVEGMEEVKDSLIICLENDRGEFYMPLFVVMAEGRSFDAEKSPAKIRKEIREECSPRHVPDAVFVIPEIPYTISGKKVELPAKKILSGKADKATLNRDALRNPESLDYFFEFREQETFKWQKD